MKNKSLFILLFILISISFSSHTNAQSKRDCEAEKDQYLRSICGVTQNQIKNQNILCSSVEAQLDREQPQGYIINLEGRLKNCQAQQKKLQERFNLCATNAEAAYDRCKNTVNKPPSIIKSPPVVISRGTTACKRMSANIDRLSTRCEKIRNRFDSCQNQRWCSPTVLEGAFNKCEDQKEKVEELYNSTCG